MAMASRSKNWVLRREGLDKLLAVFDADRERAAARYELVRVHLIKIFEGRGCTPSSDLADEVINRVIRRIEDGEEILRDTLMNYFYGVARNVFREYLRTSGAVSAIGNPALSVPISEQEQAPQRSLNEAADVETACLEGCLKELSSEARRVILAYHSWGEGEKISSRKRLAEEEGLTLNGLRIRVHRIRQQLETCALECAKRAGSSTK